MSLRSPMILEIGLRRLHILTARRLPSHTIIAGGASRHDQNGETTSYTYDDADRLTTVTDAASNVTTYAYDTESNLLRSRTRTVTQTSFSVRCVRQIDPDNFPFDSCRNLCLRRRQQPDQQNGSQGTDDPLCVRRTEPPTQKTYPDSTTSIHVRFGGQNDAGERSEWYLWILLRQHGAADGNHGEYAFLTEHDFHELLYLRRQFEPDGYTAPDSTTNTYSYDTLNRLTTLANSWAGSFGFSYDALSRRTQLTRPNSVTTNYSYDNLSRLTSVLHQLSGSTIDGAHIR